ncbi:MAG TPA: DMT family transporter [Burkholderiales bacterium]|nr:DMT family transporter [Burkholderiales bacterium]
MSATAVGGLLTGAIVWGLIWYPYRLLEAGGVAGPRATLLTYVVALLASVLAFRRRLAALLKPDAQLLLIALSAGWANLAYVLGMIRGEVMQVLLLFYLAPLWTVLFARLLLHERAGMVGAAVIVLSLIGAGFMLWQPTMQLPLPRSTAEWFGLSAGFTFALSNVLIRKARHQTIPVKSTAVFVGVVLVALVVMGLAPQSATAPPIAAGHWLLMIGLGLVLLLTNLAVQHGLTRVSANQAIVIMLFELVVGAVSAYLLAGEGMRWNEWIGAAMIVAATLLSGRLNVEPPQRSALT